MGRTVHNLTSEVERVMEIRNAPAYDPDLRRLIGLVWLRFAPLAGSPSPSAR